MKQQFMRLNEKDAQWVKVIFPYIFIASVTAIAVFALVLFASQSMPM